MMEKFTHRALLACLFLLAFSAPISIAATQTAWALALFFWIIRAVWVRPKFRPAAFDLALLAFVGLTLVSSIFSYEPAVSLRKMVAVSLVTIAYLVSSVVRDAKTLRRLVALVLIGGMISVLYTFGVLAVGKNLKVLKLAPDSQLRVAGIEENDTILKAGGDDISSPDDLAQAMKKREQVSETAIEITVYRHELVNRYPLLLPYEPADAQALGITAWARGRDTRASGFFGHYVTYAEVLQLLASLALGLLIMTGNASMLYRILLGIALIAFSGALFLTVTRASWLAFAISAAAIVVLGAGRRTLLICAAVAVLLATGGLIYLQQQRQVGFFDMNDGSTAWRLTVWSEGVRVLASDPRHLAVGIGMDSLKTHWQDWNMFDGGRLPLGHMHSNPLQLALERGIPALIAWVAWMFLYLRLLWDGFHRKHLDWPERGVILGALGGTIGFLASGGVHYNWGDSEAVMVFYLIMGMGLAITRSIDPVTEGTGTT
jgi:O-antigen ligase